MDTDALKGAVLSAVDAYADAVVADAVAAQRAIDQEAIDRLNATVDQLIAENADDDATIAGLRAQILALSPPLYVDTFASLAGFGVYNGSGSYGQQGVRLGANSVPSSSGLSVHCRPVTDAVTLGGRTLQPGDYAAGGGMWKQPLSPGCRIEMDVRMSASWGTRAVCLLWPADTAAHPWPAGGELDFVENGGVAGQDTRQSTNVTNHYLDPSRPQNNGQQIVKFGPHDFTAWSHVVVLWQTDLFVVTVDGVEAARFTTNVPSWPMKLAFQTAVEGGGQSPMFQSRPRSPGRLDVKNLEVYAA